MTTTPDIHANYLSSIVELEPVTDAGHEWIDDHCFIEPWQWINGRAAIERRCAPDILEGAADDGLIVG